ncbi:hypothetical protein HLRTI_001815 [Halorhabdus tiamatea SARL4B]|uniref:Uncharacterized protein n=1 Tax=Halorhabdus tiamatea SARL4B TaxID=1033806 RepID=F7PKQ2_9EURY|nr:hypothetical protein [Halorhabdus tiamatea]ERJ06186.1 hypothetical protein HLRTI_001815 [Halorhabdus tiamatea SARL4B]CCQ34037.1 conserved hypothetical protein [Halorhabdus tiamatea SARL4B]
MESERGETLSPAGKKSAVTVEDHLRSALNATENENVEYHIHTALEMLVGD